MLRNWISIVIGVFYIIDLIWIEVAYKRLDKKIPRHFRISLWIVGVLMLYTVVVSVVTILESP